MFREILKDIVASIPGAVGAILADWEGESVEHYFSGPDYDIKLLGAHQGILLNLFGEASDNAGFGPVKALLVKSEHNDVVVQPVKDGYYLVVLLERGANSGRALRGAGLAADILGREI